MIKKFLLVVFVLLMASAAYSKDKWSLIEYNYYSGPVSPQYQYKYSITINADGSGTITYQKGAAAKIENTFSVSKKNLSKLTSAITRSKVLTTDMNEVKADDHKIGGASRYAKITSNNTNPNLDQPPRVTEIPEHVNDTYIKNIAALYDLVESIVPRSTWDSLK